MSIWIQKGGFLTGCLLNSAVFSPFPPYSQNSPSYISQHFESCIFISDHPLTIPAPGSADLGEKGVKSLKPQGRISMVGIKRTPRMWETSGNGKG